MKSKICLYVLLCVLFVSAESVIDLVYAGYPHSGEHAVALSATADGAQIPETGSEQDANVCGHCMHGHLVGLFASNVDSDPHPHGKLMPVISASLIAYLGTPPTPPPDS